VRCCTCLVNVWDGGADDCGFADECR
jgi:hypothetical protein